MVNNYRIVVTPGHILVSSYLSVQTNGRSNTVKMTVQESAICTLIQGFPVLLILAQNHNRCLKTPFVYKPPSPTPSPEYYEALDALFQTLYGHGHHDYHHDHNDNHHGSGGDHGCHEYYGYGKKWNHDYTSHRPCYTHGHSGVSHGYPAISHGYPGHSYGYPTYGYGLHGNRGHGQYPTNIYGLKKINVSNTGNHGTGMHGYKSYAPNQVYNVNQKHKIIVKKIKIVPQRRRSQKLKGKLV